MRIVFCTASTGRPALPAAILLHDLLHNLAVLGGTGHAIALCDLGQDDEVEELARISLEDMRRGALVYFHAGRADGARGAGGDDRPHDVPFGQALNTALRLGLRLEPDVLFRLDPGHRVTAETLALVGDTFARGGDVVLHNWSRIWGDGSMGRIAMTPASWMRLGGYDEVASGHTWQDFDVLVRARARQMPYEQSARGLCQTLPVLVDNRQAEIEGFVQLLERVVPPAFADQQRFAGVLGFDERVTV
jgi:hypothetical protein